MKALNKTQTPAALAIAARIAELEANNPDHIHYAQIRSLHSEYSKLCRPTEEDFQPIPEGTKYEPVTVQEIAPGMLLRKQGFIGEVESVHLTEPGTDGPIACVRLKYVAGRVDMFNYFIGSVMNGCARGYLAYIQGNNLARFEKVANA